jgi:hypothetical protein
MKLITLIILLLSIESFTAQSYLTIGEVFDFNINDEFHYTRENQPSNGERITVIDKYYSINSDTVFYTLHHDIYNVIPDYSVSPPGSIYVFDTIIDTIFYSNLNMPIYYMWPQNDPEFVFYDSIKELDTNFCDIEMNSYYIQQYSFEPSWFKRSYGRGIGITLDYWHYQGNGVSQFPVWERIIYYKKDSMNCGSPDLTSLGLTNLNGQEDFFIFPNPSDGIISINNISSQKINIKVFNATGELKYKEKNISSEIDLSNLSYGIYILEIEINSQFYYERLIKK